MQTRKTSKRDVGPAREARQPQGGKPGDKAGPASRGAPRAVTDHVDVKPPPAISKRVSDAIAELCPGHTFEPLIGPPAGTRIKTSGPPISLGIDVVDPEASYGVNLDALKAQGVPRYRLLTPQERLHESAFIKEIEENPDEMVSRVQTDVMEKDPVTMSFEPDAVKRLYSAYGLGESPTPPNDKEQHAVRALANHALHPAATMVARLAFLKRLDEMAEYVRQNNPPEDDPMRNVIVTVGGCGAGKSDMEAAIRARDGGFFFGAMWDAAGEADSDDNAWTLRAVEARGLKVTYAVAMNEPARQYNRVLTRGQPVGRFVDVLEFGGSYKEGNEKQCEFMESAAYQRAVKAGIAKTIAMDMGPFTATVNGESKDHYPLAKFIDKGRPLVADDLRVKLNLEQVIGSAIATLKQTVQQMRAADPTFDATDMLQGALLNDEKFIRGSHL
jgi:hypothetical protein